MRKLIFIILFTLSFSPNIIANTKESEVNDEAIFKIIYWFKGRLYAMAETTGGSLKEWDELEKKAITKINKAIMKNPNSLTHTNKNKLTPLIHASILGYDFMVKQLLKHETVRNSQNQKSKSGLTALNFAIMASRQSIFACNPNIMTNTFALVPRLVTLPYYETIKPYENLLISLEIDKHPEAVEQTRQFMLKNCTNPVGYFKETVKKSETLQKDLIKLGRQTIEIFAKRQKRR